MRSQVTKAGHHSHGLPIEMGGAGLRVTACRTLVGGFCLLTLASCSNLAGPAYQRPDVPTKEAWSLTTDAKVSASETIRPDWWTGFRDLYLDGLVQKAIFGSTDIRILAARIEVARAFVGLEQAGTLPTVTGGVDAQFQANRFGRSQQFGAQASLNWELDIWGKLEKGVKAQEAEFKATEADWRAGYLTLVSDVASTYFLIRQFDEQIERQKRSLSRSEQILGILEAQNREGVVATTNLLQQQAEVNALRQQLLDLERLRKVGENRLATLLGIPAGELKVPVAALQGTVDLIDVPGGLPSDLLSRRPDIIAAEYRVLRDHELVGQARLAKLPSVSLTSSGGFVSDMLSGLLKGWTFGLAPAVNIPIFDPSVQARIKVSEAEAQVSIEQYRDTVIKAFEEVENALINVASRKLQKKQVEEQLRNLKVANDQVYAQLREGVVSQLEVFESERTLLAAQQQLLLLHQQILSDTVTLYKALGGGWPKERVTAAP